MTLYLPDGLNSSPDPILDILRRSKTIAVRARVAWLQLGIENPPASEKVRATGLLVVENACLLVEHKKRRPI